MEWNRFLADERLILFHPIIAQELGLNEAIFLQQLHYWLNRKPHTVNDKGWVYNSYTSWQGQLCFWSIDTIKRTIRSLISQKVIITGNFNKKKFDKTLWYSIDYDKLDELTCGAKTTHDECKLPPREMQVAPMDECKLLPPIPSTNTSTNNINIYGEFENVKLSEEEYNKLTTRYNDKDILSKIEDLSRYIKSTGKKYKDYYATLLNWIKRDNIKEKVEAKEIKFLDNMIGG